MPRPKNIRELFPRAASVIAHFVPRLRPHRRLAIGSLAAVLAGVGVQLVEPWPLKFVLDELLFAHRKHPDGPLAVPTVANPLVALGLACVAVVVVSVLRAWLEYAATVGFALIGSRVLTELRGDLYRHLQGLSLAFHTKSRGGDLVIRVTSDIGMLKDVIVSALLPLLANTLVLVGMMGVMSWMNWKLTLLALVVLPLFAISTIRLSGKIHEASRRQRRREGALASTASESLTAIKVVQALSLEGVFDSDFAKRSQQSLSEGVKSARLSARLERTVDMLTAVATALVLWFGARLAMRGELTPGELIVFLTYLKRGFRPLQDFAKYTARIAKATAAGERVLEILEKLPDVRDVPGAVAAPPFRGAVRFSQVTFRYDEGPAVLDQVDITVEPGEMVALVGSSGIGKSTLLGLLLRLYDPVEGRVEIDGRDVREFTIASLRAQIGVVLQDNLLFAASVRDNIAYGHADATTEEIEAAARAASADEFIRRLPDGYATVLGERGVTLSHGERQRIAIARAMIRRAPILLLDEPTTGLDEENARLVGQSLRRLAEGRTAFLVTHDMAQAAQADRIFHIAQGRIVEQQSHARAGG